VNNLELFKAAVGMKDPPGPTAASWPGGMGTPFRAGWPAPTPTPSRSGGAEAPWLWSRGKP